MSLRHWIAAIYVLTLAIPSAWAAEDWLPITPEELKMTGEPKAPGAPAIYLYREVNRDDTEYREHDYYRLKIFTEEGRKYADIEIPFLKAYGNIKNIQARTIHPDGSIVNFDGQVYEKTIVKARDVKFLAKTFTIPNVQPGSIIEYRYTQVYPQGFISDSRWLLSEELFTKRAKFSLHRSDRFSLQTSFPRGLPEGSKPPVDDHHFIRLETENIPAFQIEDYMPPQDEMKYRVEFLYTNNREMDFKQFWIGESKRLSFSVSDFTNRRKAMEQAVAQIVSPTDTPEQKLRKIYDRCQKIRNTTFERDKTAEERQRENLKEIQSVEDVWKRGYGDGTDITWLFLALARAAGFDATPVMISTRERHFFNPKMMNPDDLNTNVIRVKLDGRDLYFDPGIAFAPFGLLPWYESNVSGLVIDKDAHEWITTPMPAPSESGQERRATLQLDESGSLTGKISVTFKGLSALRRRIDEGDEDAAHRKEFLEDEIKAAVSLPVEVELTNSPDWNSSSPALVAEYNVKISGYASAAGRRALLAVGLFGGSEKHTFEGSNRVHPIYFAFPYSDVDDVTISLPQGTSISNVPPPAQVDMRVCAYSTNAENKNGAIHLNRSLMFDIRMVDPKYYPALRQFFQTVRSGDEQQVVLSPEGS